MDFKTAMEHYKTGVASEEERRLVEEELEKSQLIAEYLDAQWSCDTAAEAVSQAELKQVRRNLRKRNALIVCTCLVLVAALMAGTFQVLLPALEAQYWDAGTVSFGDQAATDLEMTLNAYDQLFSPGTALLSVNSVKSGFASYSVCVSYENPVRYDTLDTGYANLTLSKNELQIPDFWDTVSGDNLPLYLLDDPQALQFYRQQVTQKLESYSDYLNVGAYVTFSESMDMLEFIRYFNYQVNGPYGAGEGRSWIAWIAVRHKEDILPPDQLCGFSFGGAAQTFDCVNESYPYLDLHSRGSFDEYNDANVCTEHFLSLLRYSADQLDAGTGIAVPDEPNYYRDALAYIEENGIQIYGCYMVTTPQHLLKQMENDRIAYVQIDDVWIDK